MVISFTLQNPEQVCFLVPVIRELMALFRADWKLESMLYSRLVFVLPATWSF